ncbi:MAG: LPS export ABC transporter periplasmic protein LptC [Pseudomonadota bacterium]
MNWRLRSRRNANRYRLLFFLSGAIGLALASFWLLQVVNKQAETAAPDQRRNEPDYYVEKFNFVRMSMTGEARYNVSGARMVHRPLDNTYEITLPIVHSLSPGKPPLMVRSERAVATPDSNQINMIDQVVADRPASPESEAFNLKSEYLQIFPDEEILRTDKEVDIVLGQARMSGVGMVANNATREISLAQRVRGTFPPRGTAQ